MPEQPLTFNPYASIGNQIKPGLDAIISALPSPATATPDLLVDEVFNYVSSVYYPSPSIQTENQIKSIAYNVINSIRNSLVLSGNADYNSNQYPFIGLLMGASMIAGLPPTSFADRLADIEDNIGTSNLTITEQTPLFLATTNGKNVNSYFLNELARGGASAWKDYFSSVSGENYMNTIYWGTAAINGTLAAYGAPSISLIAPTTDFVTSQQVAALIGALTASAGKVMFKWIPRITKPLNSGGPVISGPVTPGPVTPTGPVPTTSNRLTTGGGSVSNSGHLYSFSSDSAEFGGGALTYYNFREYGYPYNIFEIWPM